jgi:hypothetical protein
MATESEVTLPDALAWLKSLSGDYAAKIDEFICEKQTSEFKKGFWWGFERARVNPETNDIQSEYCDVLALKKANEDHKKRLLEICREVSREHLAKNEHQTDLTLKVDNQKYGAPKVGE